MSETIKHPAVVNLRTEQRQLDPDGIAVAVSRQAVEETLGLLDEMAAELVQIEMLEGRADGSVGMVDHPHIKALRAASKRARDMLAKLSPTALSGASK